MVNVHEPDYEQYNEYSFHFGEMSRCFVEHCEAVAAEIDIKRRWLGEQGHRESSCLSGVLPEQHVTLEVACEPSVVGSL
jgi:hypothetical protein